MRKEQMSITVTAEMFADVKKIKARAGTSHSYIVEKAYWKAQDKSPEIEDNRKKK